MTSFGLESSSTVLLQLERASESLGALIKTKFAGLHPQKFGAGVRLENLYF